MYNAQRVPNDEATEVIDRLVSADPATAYLWEMTRQVLHLRPGWNLYVDEDDEFAWFFGMEGQSLLVVTVEPHGLYCHHHRADTDETVNSARALWEWARAREDAEEEAGARELVELARSFRHELHDERLEKDLPPA